jgi:hypothetical protein
MPDEAEAHGLLALMLLHDSRRQARFHGDDLILLAIQDRSLWNGAEIAEGRRILSRARILAREGSGQYVIQAAIAALHTAAPVDWPEIAPFENSTICMPHAATYYAGPAARLKPASPINAPSPSSTTTLSGGFSSDGSPSSPNDRPGKRLDLAIDKFFFQFRLVTCWTSR